MDSELLTILKSIDDKLGRMLASVEENVRTDAEMQEVENNLKTAWKNIEKREKDISEREKKISEKKDKDI